MKRASMNVLTLPPPIRATRAIINRKALEHNLQIFQQRVPGGKIMAPVKADAYGHGIIEVAQICASQGCEFLAVATLGEFVAIRKAGVETPILILQDLFPDEAEYAILMGARLSCGSIEYANLLSQLGIKLKKHITSKILIHINVDTGIGRMGLYSNNLVDDVVRIFALPSLQVEGVFTHFVISDEGDKSFAWEQLGSFKQLKTELESRLLIPTYWHVGNTGALIDFHQKLTYNLARPGVGIYGMYPSKEVDHSLELQPVMELVSKIVKVTHYQGPWTIGYGRTHKVTKGSRIGIVPIGYGDGYRREFSNKAQVICQGQLCPVVGRVSMDMITVELSHLSAPIEPGEPVVLMGTQDWQGQTATITTEDLAAWANTITYEITCGLTSRVPREYR